MDNRSALRTSACAIWNDLVLRAILRRLGALLEPQQLAAQVEPVARGKIKRSVAAEVLDPDIGPRAQERNRDIAVTAKSRAYQRRAAAIVARVDARACGQQRSYGFRVAATGGLMQCGFASVIARIHIRPVSQQYCDDADMAMRCGQHQRRIAVAVRLVHVRAA